MAVLKDLIVHGSSRFLNAAYFNSLAANKVAAEEGVFNKLIATSLTAEQASITDLTAQNARVVGLLDVQGELHTNAWTNANIANIGGSFYISPTVEPTDGTTTISITRNSATSWTIKASGTFATDFIKSGDATSGVVWPANSLVLITGDIEIGNMRYPLGTLKGTLSAQVNATAATTSKEITITGVTDAQNRNNPSVLQELYELNGNANISNAPFKNGKISLYKLGSNPIGILMTSMGTNSNSLIDIYGGVSTGPTVRIGHLGALSSYTDSAGNTHQPKGWGIYTDNGYFKGVVIADSGLIGHFTINSKAIYSGSHDTWNKSNTGIFLGTNDSNYYISGGSGASWWIRDDGRFQFGGTNGITYNGTTLSVPAVSVTGTLTASQVDVSGIISAGSIVTNTLTGGTFNTADYIRVSTQASSSLAIGTSGAKTDWRIIAGKTFGVDRAGNLYATNANITGTVDATSFTAKYYSGSSLSRQMALTGDGLKLMDGSGNILSQIDGTASTIGQTTGNNYNINITGSAIDLRYNTNILNRINNNGLTIYDGSGTADTNIRAKFGTTIQLGKSNSEHIKISTDGLEYFSGSTRYARFGAWARIGSESSMHLTASEEGLQFAGGNGRTVFNVCLPGTTTARYITDRFNSATAALLGTPVNNTEIRVRCGDSYIETMYEFTAGFDGTKTYNKGNSNFTITYNANTATITASGSNSPKIKWVNYQANFPDLYTTLGIRTTIPGDGENPSAYYTPGLFSLVQGIQCRASGLTSVALNYGTIADGENQTAIGEWNKVDTTNLFIVGNGASDSNRSNALAVARDGNLYIKGQVYVGCNADSTGGTQLGGVTGVKGNSESSYRTGQVNLTAANVGALATSGGTITSNLTVNGVITAGAQVSSTAPSSETSVNRITITPYFHTGGPWYIKSTDNSSTAFLDLYYGSSQLIRVSHSGEFYFNGTSTRVAGMKYTNGYWGLTLPTGATDTSSWVRTTQAGLIPYQSGGRGSGHCFVGTDSWYFQHGYIDNVHGVTLDFSGAATIGGATTINNALYCDVLYTGSAIVNADLSVGGVLRQSSDRRLKKHISYLDERSAAEFIRSLRPAHYIKNEKKELGFYAQDIQENDKWDCLVESDEKGMLNLSYSELIAPLVSYCHQLEKRIEELEAKL